VLVAGQGFQPASAGGGAQQPAPPKGLQLTLSAFDVASGTAAPTPAADTLVMQNLGYFQLLANPGLWKLDVAGGNFTILSGSGQAQENAATTRLVALRAFTGQVNRVMVSKNTPDESRQLKAKASTGSIWGSLFGSSGSSGATVSGANETIHVFSLATGHMYERLLRIMMLSVVKRASVKVKFWLFENYLSPTFKNVAAAMADEYGFEVAYVTYKWPEWLTQQTEKQRIIWGYKILFLDVLFPLDVKRIIYVDADQVVRADLKELWDLDLKGKPYGYTPFCSSREETLGFQFWRSGYWAEHLRGKPYHISALYVVDLQRFREFSVGDQLRAVYDGLARDPNSLANLDQDLPNYAQHSVPIHSLPQEWLWCETWCSDKTKEKVRPSF
jgi:UDP-glucose:glycoprotein glucosyltransferase